MNRCTLRFPVVYGTFGRSHFAKAFQKKRTLVLQMHAFDFDASSENKIGSRQALLSLEDAIRIATSFARIIERSEIVPLANSIDRRLYCTLIAEFDLPPFDQSAMDGFALSGPGRSETYAFCRANGFHAGDIPNPISPGQATRIATGACIPAGADRVVLHEHTIHQADQIVLEKGVERGANIRLRGEDIRRGEHLLPKGARLDARKIALLAAQGMAGVEVQSRPRVAVVSSGSELHQPGEALGTANVFDCNRPMLMALAVQAGAEVVDGGCCRDDVRTLSRIVSKLSEDNDFIVLSGGSSIGEGDVTSSALTHAGAVVEELKIAMKPGKPAVVGKLGKTSILGVPGNPLAAFVSWFVLGRSMMAAMFGLPLQILRGRDLAVLIELQRRPGRIEFVPARLVRSIRGEMVEFLSGGSGRLLPLSRAEGLACIEEARGSVHVGDHVTFIPFDDCEPL